jgi:hypothetical protein
VDARKNVMVDVWLRRTGSIPRATTMFVHLVRRAPSAPGPLPSETYDYFNADHQVVGGSFYLSDAPEGALVHDAFGAHVDGAVPGTYDVWVGFGDVSGRKGRSGVREPGAARVSESRVLVGTFDVR